MQFVHMHIPDSQSIPQPKSSTHLSGSTGAAHRSAVDRAPAIGVTFGSVMQIVVQRMLAAALVWFAADPSAADPFAAKRDRMVRGQIEARGVSDADVLRVMRSLTWGREVWRRA